MLPTWLTDTVTSDLDRALHYTMLWGLEAVELRTVGSAEDLVPFVNEEKLRRRLMEHELEVAAVVPGLFAGPAGDRATWMNDLLRLDEVLAFCRRIGCERVVVSSFTGDAEDDLAQAAEALRRAATAAAKRDVRLAVLNEAAGLCPTGARLADLLQAVDHPTVGAAWKPAEAVKAGEEATDGLAALAGRIELVRCSDVEPSDAAWDDGWADVLIGEGVVGWPDLLPDLYAAGFDGPLSLEVTVEPKPKSGLRDASTLIQLARQAAR